MSSLNGTGRRRFLYAMAIFGSITMMVWLAGSSNALGWNMTATIVVAALAGVVVIVGLLHFRLVFINGVKSGHVPIRDGASPAVADLVLRASRTAWSRTPGQLIIFRESIARPARLCQRLVEEIRPVQRTVRQSVSRTFVFPIPVERMDEAYFVPVLTVPKGELQDDLKITLEDGSLVSVLNYSEYLNLVVHALRLSFVSAAIDGSEAWRVPAVEEDALELVAQRGKVLKDPRECIERIEALVDAAAQPRHLWAVAEMVKALAHHYPIVALVPSPAQTQMRTIIKYERLIVPRLRSVTFAKNRLRYLRDKLGHLVGTKPVELDLTLDNASFAQSYHIQVFGPEGTYLGFQDVPEVRESIGVNAYFRFRRRLGQAYAHGYFRAVPPDAGPKLRLTVRFFEIPPGSIAKASIGAFANFLLMFAAGVLLGTKQAPVASDFPVLVLTIPAAVSAWVGLDAAGRQLLDGTLSSRLSSMFTLFASLASSVLYMAQVAGQWKFPQDHFNFFGVRDTVWQILVFGALMNFLWTTYLWIGRASTYYCLADRDVQAARVLAG